MTLRGAVLRVAFLAASATLLLVAALAWALLRPGPAGVTELEVPEGAPAASALVDLRDLGLIPSPLAARLYIAARGRGRSPRFGRYLFPSGGRPVDVLEQLLDGRVEIVTVTVLEGTGARDIGERFAASGIGTPAEWTALLGNAAWVHDIAPEASSLEGFLFPDTYRAPAGASAERVARLMVQRFHEVWREEVAVGASRWAPPLQVVTLASMVEAETPVAAERARIAGVFVNRLRLGMLLQCDPTVAFALKRRGEWSGHLLRAHWQLDDPYNTYRYPGLPPGPINCPGRASLAAAMRPERHDYLYFVAKPGHGHAFSSSLEEHNRAVAALQRARR